MPDWQARDDPIAMAASAALAVAAAGLLACLGFARADAVTATDAALGVAGAVTVVGGQTWFAVADGAVDSLLLRGLSGAAIGVATVGALDAAPATVGVFGGAAAPLALASRLALYRRATGPS